METIPILTQKTNEYEGWKVIRYTIIPPLPVTSFKINFGIDPGTSHMGVASLYCDNDGNDRAMLWQIIIDRAENPIERILLVQSILDETIKKEKATSRSKFHQFVIEGASFGNNFRQVELAEQRASMVMCVVSQVYYPTSQIHIVPPTTIRKAVLGSGKVKAHDIWQLESIPKGKQPNDALAALACAYYTGMKD